MTRLAWLFACALAAGCAAAGPRGGSTVPGSPGAWVDLELAPAVADTLRTHPRFRGESLVVGLPEDVDGSRSRLEERLDQVLLSRLLHAPGLRIRAAGQDACGEDAAAYRMGLVVTAAADATRVELRVLDTASGEWVTGVADSWEGYLDRRDTFDQAMPAERESADGSRERPFDQGEQDRLARTLANDLSCELVASRQAAGPIRPGDDSLARLVAGHLAGGPYTRSSEPGWRLSIDRAEAGPQSRRVTASLASGEAIVTATRYIRTAATAAMAGTPRETVAPPVRPARPAKPRLAALPCGEGCAGVRVTSRTDPVVFVVVPGRGLASASDCVQRSGADEFVARISAGTGGWAGFYAVSASGPARRELGQLESRLPSACGTGQLADTTTWLTALDDFVAANDPQVTWSTLQVNAGAQARRRP